MIEAASLGVGVEWEDAGAVRGMKDLQQEVQTTARKAQDEFRAMGQDVQNSMRSAFLEGNPAFRGLKDLQSEVAKTAETTRSSVGGASDVFARLEQGVKSAFSHIGGLFDGLGQTARSAFSGLGTTLSGFGERLTGVLSIVGKMAPVAIGAIATIAGAVGGVIAKVTKDLIALGSAAEDKMGKFNVVFGNQAALATQQLAAYGAAVNRSRYELQEMATAVQGTFVPLGFARDQAAGLSVSLTKLATDVASFNKASDANVMSAFTSAIQGNHEAVRQYGIVITDAALNSELLAMGLERGVRGASEMEKAQARLNLITRQTADAQGYAERTAGGWSNTMQGLRVALSDAYTDIGRQLLPLQETFTPALEDLLVFVRDIAPSVVIAVTDIMRNYQAMVDVLGRLDLSGPLGQIRTFLETILSVDSAGAFGFLAEQIALTVANIRQLTFEVTSYADAWGLVIQLLKGDVTLDEFKVQLDELREGYHAGQQAIQETYEQIQNTDYTKLIEQTAEINRLNAASAERWRAIGESYSTLPESLDEVSEATGKYRDHVVGLVEVIDLAEGRIVDHRERLGELAGGAVDLADIWAQAYEAMQAVTDSSMDNSRQKVLDTFAAMADDYGQYASTMVALEQERTNVLAFLDSQYQAERARLQASGDTQSLQLLNSAHKAKYSNVVAYYNQRIKTEQAGQQSVYNVAKAYYMHTLLMMRTQMVAQLKTVAATMDALVRSMVGGYGVITAAAYAAKLAQEGKALAEIQAGIADVEGMMAALQGSGVAAASQASVAFDEWKDTVGDLGGELGTVGDGIDKIGDKVGGSGGVREKIIDPMEEAAKVAQGLAQMVDKAVEAFDLLAEYGGPAPGWVTGYRKLLQSVETMVRMFAETTQRIVEAGVLAQERRDQIGNAVTVITGAIKAISDALRISEAFEEVDELTANVSQILDRLTRNTYLMVRKIMEISTSLNALGDDKLRTAARDSEYLVAALKPWSEAVKAVQSLVNLPAVDAQQFVDRSVGQIVALAKGMVEVGKQVDGADLRQAAKTAGSIVDALKPWEPTIKAIQAIVAAPLGAIGDQTQKLMDDMLALVETLIGAQDQLDSDQLADAGKSAALIVEALRPWEVAAKAVQAVVATPAGNIGNQADVLMDGMFTLVQKLIFAQRTFDPAALEEASRLAGKVVEALKPWEAAAKAVQAVAATPAGNIGDQADVLMDGMFTLVQKLIFAQRTFDLTALEEASRLAGKVVEALKPWEAAAKAVQAVAATPAGNIGDQADVLMNGMFTLVQKLIFAQRTFDLTALEEAGRLAEPLIDALKPWEAAAKAVEAIAGSTWEKIGPRASGLVDQMFNLIRKLSLHSADVDMAELQRLGRLAQPLIDALKPWEAAAKAVEAIAGSTWEKIGPRASGLVDQMFNVIRKLSLHSADVDMAELQRLGRLAEPLIDALKPWEAAANAVNAIAAAAVGRIGPAAELLVNQIFGLTRKLARIAGQIRPEDLATAASSAALFVKALEPWESAARAVDAIARTSGERIGPQAERLVNQMLGLARKLARVSRDMPAGQLQEAARAAALFSASLKPWQEAMTTVQALSEFANSTRIGPAAERLVMQMMGLARKLARVGREIGLTDLEYAARVGKLFGEVLEPWNKAITLSNDLRMWRELPDLKERMTRFARMWIDIVADLSKSARELSTQGLEAAAAFGRSLSDLMNGLQAALTVVEDFDFEEPDPTTWANFQGWVQRVFDSYYSWINNYVTPEPGLPAVPSFNDKGLQSVTLFAQALRDLMGGLEAALGIARDFEFQEPDPTMWAHFQGWVQSVFVSFYDWVNATAPAEPPMPGVPLFGGDGLAAMSAFAGALNSLMQGLQAALGIARDFEFQEPPEDQWAAFFTWVTGVFQAFYDDITTAYPTEDPATTFAPVTAWGGALGALMGGLQGALTLAKDFEFQEPPEDQWNAFFGWVTTVFTSFETAITEAYPTEDPATTFAPVTAWGGALGSLMGGLQAALGVASGFQFQEPAEDQWAAFFAWTTTVFTDFEEAINTAYPIENPEDTFAPVAAWANAFGSLMGGLQAAIDLVSEFDWQEPPEDQWDEFMVWSLAVLTSFRDAIIEDYPNANAATWAPVVAWSGALTALMQALQAAVTTADSFAFIPPDELGWSNFFTWVFRVFDEFRLEVLRVLPENPIEANQFAPVIALSNAISAIFSGLQSALAFFMDMHGPGEAFWTFLGGAAGNPDTSPFAQRMGYIIGAITGTMAAFDAWVVLNAPTWTGNANTLLTRITTITGILQDAIELFDFMDNTTLPSTAEIELFVAAVLQLFSSFAGQLGNLVGEGGMGSHVNAVVNLVSGFVATTMPPLITSWHDAGEDLVEAFVAGLAAKIGPEETAGTVAHALKQIRNALATFTGWWVPTYGLGYWFDAGDDLVDAFISGMESNLGNPEGAVYNAAFAIGQAANAGLEAGAAAGSGGYRPEGPTAGLGKVMTAGTFGWSTPSVSTERNINVTIRFENPPANMDRRALDELKRTLVYEIRRGA